MKIIRLLLLACSITIHFFIVKEHVFKIFNQHAYYFLFAFYVLIVFCFLLFFKRSFIVDLIACMIIPYISSVISFLFLSMLISPHLRERSPNAAFLY